MSSHENSSTRRKEREGGGRVDVGSLLITSPFSPFLLNVLYWIKEKRERRPSRKGGKEGKITLTPALNIFPYEISRAKVRSGHIGEG